MAMVRLMPVSSRASACFQPVDRPITSRPLRAESSIGLVGGHERPQQGGLAGAGHAGQEAEIATRAQGIDGRLLRCAVLGLPGEVEARGVDSRPQRGR